MLDDVLTKRGALVELRALRDAAFPPELAGCLVCWLKLVARDRGHLAQRQLEAQRAADQTLDQR